MNKDFEIAVTLNTDEANEKIVTKREQQQETPLRQCVPPL